MFPKNINKILDQEQKDQELNNKKPSTFKNLYAKIRKNIRTSFPRSKQKNSLNIIKSKKLTENGSKKNHNHNINLFLTKKPDESRNYNTNNGDKIYDNNQDEEIFEYDDNLDNFNFNKTQKNDNLYTNNNSKRVIISNLKITKNDSKNDEKDLSYKRNQLYYYSNKNNYSKEEINKNTNKIFLQNKNIKSNKELKKLIIGNNLDKKEYIENNESKSKINEKERKDSYDKKYKLFINKKLISKEELLKTKNLYEKVQSARLVNYDSHKFNINMNNDINNEIKNDSNKKTFRMNSQKNVKLNDKDFETKTINEIKKITKNKIIKQLTKQNSKNHSMNINSNNKTFLLNDTLKDNINKSKKKYSIANIYNYPITISNNKQTIPFDRDLVFDSADKKNKDNGENNYLKNYYNMDHTCINFNNNINMNNTMNNNNCSINNTNEKNTPNSKLHNSFSKPYSQEKISSLFYSKPVARLKKRIFNSPSDKDLQNSINYVEINNYNGNYKNKDSLEINTNKKDNYNYKELLIYIKILNQIVNTQKKIIRDYIENEIILKQEIEQKDKEIMNYKNACLKLIFHLKNEKEINISSNINKKRNEIQSQLLKENNILRLLLLSPKVKIQKNNKHRNDVNNLDLYSKSFCNSNIINDDSSINIYHLKKDNYNNLYKMNEYYSITKDKKEKSFNSLYYNNDVIVNKKREKSYENRKHRIKRDTLIKVNKNRKIEDNEIKSNKKICYIVKDKNIAFSFEKNVL